MTNKQERPNQRSAYAAQGSGPVGTDSLMAKKKECDPLAVLDGNTMGLTFSGIWQNKVTARGPHHKHSTPPPAQLTNSSSGSKATPDAKKRPPTTAHRPHMHRENQPTTFRVDANHETVVPLQCVTVLMETLVTC